MTAVKSEGIAAASSGVMYGATWEKGIDLVAVERAASLRGVCPLLRPEEARRTVSRWRDEMGLSS